MYWNQPIETIGREQLEVIQLSRLQKTVAHVYQNVASYRTKMQALGLTPEAIQTLSDIRKLPFTDKEDLRANYPYGLFAVPQEQIVRVHASSGTTGKQIVAGYTQKDLDLWAELVARCLGCAHVSRQDTVQVSYGYGLFTGGLGLHYGVERLGGQVVPTSAGNTKRQITLMQDLGTSVLACTPSYALMISESLAEMNFDRDALKLKTGIFGAEPWTEAMREEIEKALNIKALDIYGLTETIGPGVAMECAEEQHGLHLWEDHFYMEILDPDTCEPLPDGEMGELVITTLSKQGMPTLRYRTHDLTAIIPEPCACGRTHRRIRRLHGRTDDMLIIRGVNVFPSQVEAAVVGVEGIAPRYLLVVNRVNNRDILEVQVELAPNLPFDEVRKIEELRNQLRYNIEQVLGISIELTLKEPGSIERSQGKSRRVVDNRKLN